MAWGTFLRAGLLGRTEIADSLRGLVRRREFSRYRESPSAAARSSSIGQPADAPVMVAYAVIAGSTRIWKDKPSRKALESSGMSLRVGSELTERKAR